MDQILWFKQIMKRKPIQILTDKIGKKALSEMVGVNLATIYLWLQREAGKPGRKPNLESAIKLSKIAEREGVKSLTLSYLVRL